MPIELRILSGARAGHTETFTKDVIAIGRHPMSDLRFDPKQDLDVSTRHGEIRFVDGRYAIYDAQSTNGTFVNGKRVTSGGLRELRDSDVISFGNEGPKVSVHVDGKLSTPIGQKVTAEIVTPPVPVAAQPDPMVQTMRPRKRSTGERVAIAVAQQTRSLRIAVIAAIVVLGGIAGGVYYKSARDSERAQREIQSLIAANAEMTKRFETQLQGDTALAKSLRARSENLQRLAREARGAERAAAAAALQKNNEMQVKFTQMDPQAVVAANTPAVALITSQVGSAKPMEGTGFGVTSSGLVVTNRHVVVDAAGNRASAIFVKFSNSTGNHRARLVRFETDSAVDLALLQVEGSGPFPTVKSVAPNVDAPEGAAIMTLGFPLGTDLPMEGSVVKPSLTIGVISRSIADRLQIDAYAAAGSSGSPVFDNHGHVIGVVWGGVENTGERIVYAVPAQRINELLKKAK